MRKPILLVLVALFALATVFGGFDQQKSVFAGSSKEVNYLVNFVSGLILLGAVSIDYFTHAKAK